ncbi:MAG: hypothetical protein QOK17_1163 [Sphingomonadales bacterium]|nr:hypothetical protein [Sphingomonadales bacterium]
MQLSVPVAIHRALRRAVGVKPLYRRLAASGSDICFQEHLYEPLIRFVSLRSPRSRALFSLLCMIGFMGFVWNTYNNIYPEDIPRAAFWDSSDFMWGYFGTRLYKFYMDALLLPSIIHTFAGIILCHTAYLKLLTRTRRIRILPFSSDRTGGLRFLADLILSPVITALLASGLAFLGAVYTHRSFDITVGSGTVVEISILVAFYVVPTILLRGIITQLKSAELLAIDACQQSYYAALMNNNLEGEELKEAHEHSQYLLDVSDKIRKITNWPHLARVFGAFSLSITPGLVVSTLGIASHWAEILLARK